MVSSRTSLLYSKFLCIIVLCCFTLTKPCTPENTTIVWDLNGVLLKSDKSAMMSALWNCSHKCDILKQSISTVIQIFRSLSKYPSTFEEYIEICKPCNPHLATLMRTMHGCQKLSPEMVNLVRDLHARGYTLGIATNMGHETLNNLKQRYPEFFAHFSVIASPDTIDPTGTFIKKPDIRFFELYQKHHNKEGKHIIFIDDRAKNIHAAEQAGMQGIQFKNPQQLHTALQGSKLIGV